MALMNAQRYRLYLLAILVVAALLRLYGVHGKLDPGPFFR